MTKAKAAPANHPEGATTHLGGDAWTFPTLDHQLVPIDQITLYPGNPRRGDQHAITTSIHDHGLYAGVVTQQSTGHVLVGNHRTRALLDLGATRIPVATLDVSDARARAIVARDNRTSDRGGYDDTELLALLELITADGTDLPSIGYEEEDLVTLRRALEDLAFTETAALAGAGTPVGDLSTPIDIGGDTVQVNVTVLAESRQDLYALLDGPEWVLNVTDAYVRKPQP